MRLFSLKNIQFGQILQDIQNYLAQSNGPQKTINSSTVFGQLITVVAGLAHNIMLYIEDALVEQNKYTAQRKKSIMALAAQSGYQPSYGKAAGVWVRIAHKSNNRIPLDVILQEHTRIVCTANGLYYNLVLNRPAVVLKCDTNLANEYFYAVQGNFESQQMTVAGGPLYVQNFKFIGFVDTDYITIRVNGERWEQEPSLYDMSPNSKTYTVRYNPVEGVDVIFGNGIYGKQLLEGDTIEISYLLHDGEAGNVESQENSYFIFARSLQDIAGDQVDGNACFDISFANSDAVAAGSNSETLDQVSKMIGFNTRSLVLSDSNAYSALLNKYSFVGYNRTWSNPGSLVINSLVMRNYKLDMKSGLDYFTLTPDKFKLSDIQKNSIQKAITASGQQLAGTTYNIIDIELCKYALFIYIKLKDLTSDHEIVSNKIRKNIGDFFGNIQSDSYIPKSDIINLIKQNVEEVDGVTCYFLSEANELAIQRRWYDEKITVFDPLSGSYKDKTTRVMLDRNENPMLGLDAHGNIVVDKDNQFPVLMGGWDWVNSQGQEVDVVDPCTIIYE